MSTSLIIDLLGGIRPTARKLGHKSHTTVQGWKVRGAIPPTHWGHVTALAAAEGYSLRPEHFLGWDPLPLKHDNDNPRSESVQQ